MLTATIFRLLLHFQLLAASQSLSPAPDERSQNPYKSYDDKPEHFLLSEASSHPSDILANPQRRPYPPFAARQRLVPIREAFNSKFNLSSKLAGKLLYFLTNGHAPLREKVLALGPPFLVAPQKIDLGNLAPHASESLSVTLRLRPGVAKAEVLDVVPSSDQVLTLFCGRDSLVRKPACAQTVYDTDDANIAIVINYRVIPKKTGLSHFRLYLLCKINDSVLSVVTIVGQYLVNRAISFSLQFYNPHFLVRYGQTFYNYLWLKNNGSANAVVSEIFGYGLQLGLNYPPKFKKKHFAQQQIPAELRKRVEESEPTFWIVPPREERPIIEIFFATMPEANFPREAQTPGNKTKSEAAPEKKSTPLPEKTISAESSDPITLPEPRKSQLAPEIPPEPVWPHLEFNLFKITVDSKTHYLSLMSYFNREISFWDHESLNFGVLCSRGLRHEAAVFAANRLGRPALLLAVDLEQDDPDFRLEVASVYRHALPLPFADARFLLLKLVVRYSGKREFAVLRASLVARIEIGEESYVERLPVFAAFAENLFEVSESGIFVAENERKKFEVRIRQNAAAEVIVNKIELFESQGNDKFYAFENVWERNTTTSKHSFLARDFRHVFNFEFRFSPEEKFKNYKNRFAVVIYALENIFTVALTFLYKTPLCSRGLRSKIFFPCDRSPALNFGIFSAENQIKARRMRLWNKLPDALFLESLEIQAPHPSFMLSVDLTLFSARGLVKKGKRMMTAFDATFPVKMPILRNWTCELEFSVQYSPGQLSRKPGVNSSFSVRFLLRSGRSFRVGGSFQFFKGRISYRPRQVTVNFLYPGPPLTRGFRISSTFAEELAFEDTSIAGPSKDMLQIVQFDRARAGNEMLIRFSVDPGRLLRGTSFYSQTNQTEDAPCLWDLERYNNTHMVWQKLLREGLDKISAAVHVVTNLKRDIKIAVRGRISYPEIAKVPLVLENNAPGADNFHSLTLRNPFRRKMRLRLFLAPQTFLGMDGVDDEIIALIERQARPEGLNVICVEHPAIGGESLRFFSRRLYLENLEFVGHPKPHLASQNHACFKFPEAPADREKFFVNFKSTTNFFFKFSQYNDRQDKTELLSKFLILIDDIRKYSDFDPYQEKSQANRNFSESVSVWGYFGEIAHFANSLKSLFLSFFLKSAKKEEKKTNVIFLNHVKSLEEHLAKKNVFLNPLFREKAFVIPSMGSLRLKDALIVRSGPDGNFGNFPVNLLLKNNITALYKIPIIIKRANVKFEQINFKKKEAQFWSDSDKILYLSVPADNFTKNFSKTNKVLLFYKKPIIKQIELQNTGSSSIRINKAIFGNGKRRSGCLEIFDFRPKLVRPGKSLTVNLLIVFCRKINAFYNEKISLHSKSMDFDFRLIIKLEGFYVNSVEPKLASAIFWYLQNLIYAIFVFKFLWSFLRRKKQIPIELTPKKVNAVFIPEELLKEKLLVYNCRTNPTDFELTGRLSPLPSFLLKLREVQRIKLVGDKNNGEARKREIFEGPKRGAKRSALAKIPREKHHYSNNNQQISPIENSYMSVEQICQMLDPNRSSSEDRLGHRRRLIHQAEFSRDEIDPRAENRFGSIGDHLGGRDEASNSSFQTDHLNDISHSKANRAFTIASRQNPEMLVYSFMNKKQLEEEIENEGGDEGNEDSGDFDQEIKEHQKLGQLFDILPLTSPGVKTQLNFLSQKMVTFKMEESEGDARRGEERARTKTEAKPVFRKNSEQSNSEVYPRGVYKSHTENLEKRKN